MKIKIINLTLALCVALLVGNGAWAQSSDKGSGSKTAAEGSTMRAVPISNGVAILEPSNTKIEFIGTHVGDEPKPRLGGFMKFKGKVKLAADNSVESMKLEIDINSVWTQFDDLTKHLKNADFFETDKFDSAKFESTKIAVDDSGEMQVTGNLMLHGTTKEITFPVKGKLDNSGLMMTSEFKLDRTMFGMDKMTSGVEKTISMKFIVGQATDPSKSMPGPGTEKKSSSKNGTSDFQLVSLVAPNMT